MDKTEDNNESDDNTDIDDSEYESKNGSEILSRHSTSGTERTQESRNPIKRWAKSAKSLSSRT